jgi:nucleoside-diphosphate-sugar epimerase
VLSRVLARARFRSLLYLSSTRVYGGLDAGVESSALTVRPLDSSDLYNLSKLTGESLCLHSGRERVRVVRLSNVVGGDEPGSPNFLPSIIREARSGLVRLRTAPSSSKDYIHIGDVVQLLTAIALEGRHAIYNVASGHAITHALLLELLQRRFGCRVELDPNAPKVQFPRIDITRISDEFGFRPKNVLNWLAESL